MANIVFRKSKIQQTLSAEFKLTWSHYLKLMRITNVNERNFYEIESIKNNWSLRELQRQYDSALYTRLAISKNKEEIRSLGQKGQIIEKNKDLIKDPYVLEFLGLPEQSFYSESDLEQKLIDKLEHFLLELGNGFTFVARQKRITFEERHFKIDLVFYNRILKCFVLIDLKIGELKHQDIGQMQMYVNYFDREVKLEDENKTIGIILCQDKSESVVRYTLPENNEQIFASKYLTVLPSEKDFIKIIEN
ncbi:PDDEXK nuclease domain-containing protein [Pedobacter sp. P26]|uniref:PDDEXK nuclease domain-containing protein n=1 Tax=Pedobacter sp. P26 TaxID=3423956 RepID=UPI003D676E32